MLVFVVAYSLELDSVAFLLCDLFTLIRVYCLACIWLYSRLKLLFAALLLWSVIGGSLSLLYVIV